MTFLARRRAIIREVARKHHGPAHEQQADPPARHSRTSFKLDNAHFNPGQRLTNSARTIRFRLAYRDYGRTLGDAVTLRYGRDRDEVGAAPAQRFWAFLRAKNNQTESCELAFSGTVQNVAE